MGAMADATYTAVDLSRLPAPDIIEALDFNTIEADAVARMVALMPDFESRDSDPATKLLQVVSYIVQLVRQRVNGLSRRHAGLCRGCRPRQYRGPVRHHPPDDHSGRPKVPARSADGQRRQALALSSADHRKAAPARAISPYRCRSAMFLTITGLPVQCCNRGPLRLSSLFLILWTGE